MTGEELGRIMIVQNCVKLRAKEGGLKPPKDTLSAAAFKREAAKLSPEEKAVLKSWADLGDELADFRSFGVLRETELRLNLEILSEWLLVAIVCEESRRILNRTPAIVTPKEFEGVRKSLSLDEDHKPETVSFFGICYLSTREPEILKQLEAVYQSEPVINPRILAMFNEVKRRGYWQLETGERSDEVEPKEWEELELTEKGKTQRKDKDSDWTQSAYIDRAQGLYFGRDRETAQEMYNNSIKELGLYKEKTWHLYDTPPANLSKWELIKDGDLCKFYPALSDDETASAADYRQQLKEFKKDFGELVRIVCREINVQEPKDWRAPIWKPFEIDRLQVVTEEAALAKSPDPRARSQGIAVLQRVSYTGERDAASPVYQDRSEDELWSLCLSSGVEQLCKCSPEYRKNRKRIADRRRKVYACLWWLYCQNYALNMYSREKNCPEILAYQIPESRTKPYLEQVEALVYWLYGVIYDQEYKDQNLKEEKLAALKASFAPFNYYFSPEDEDAAEKASTLWEKFDAIKGARQG